MPLRVLIVEDEPLIALTAGDMLTELGHSVVASPASLAEALQAFDELAFDLALLDVQIGDETCAPAADRLRERGVPFLLTTGYAEGHGGIEGPTLAKPYTLSELETALARFA